MTRELRRLAAQVRGIYVDTDPLFTDAGGFMKAGGTVEGVHPTLESYAVLGRSIQQAIVEALKYRGHPCRPSAG